MFVITYPTIHQVVKHIVETSLALLIFVWIASLFDPQRFFRDIFMSAVSECFICILKGYAFPMVASTGRSYNVFLAQAVVTFLY